MTRGFRCFNKEQKWVLQNNKVKRLLLPQFLKHCTQLHLDVLIQLNNPVLSSGEK